MTVQDLIDILAAGVRDGEWAATTGVVSGDGYGDPTYDVVVEIITENTVGAGSNFIGQMAIWGTSDTVSKPT